MQHAISVRGLEKSYGSHAVLKSIDFDVIRGEIFALLGVNGAGKTTTLSCIEGLKKYEKGDIDINGKMGIQLQSASLPAYIKSMEAVRLFAKWNKTSIDESMLAVLDIPALKNKCYFELSTGQKRRLHLALALTGNPDILFLDEPTAGLDVEGRAALHKLIRRLKTDGKTIILASHDMAEVEALCDRIVILNEGKIIFTGTAAELTEQMGKHYIVHIKTEQGSESLETDSIEDTLLSLLSDLKQKGNRIQDIKVDRGTLEQHFMEITRRTNA